jgi:predicted HAD superfamily Cof-like phosphohydrolase
VSIELVREFHDAFGVPNASEPTVDDERVSLLRIRLISEELNELCIALGLSVRIATVNIPEDQAEPACPVATLDALTDLEYVVSGSWLQLGFAEMHNDALLEVHRSNLEKRGPNGLPVFDALGKLQKPADWRAPNLSAVIRRHKRGGES